MLAMNKINPKEKLPEPNQYVLAFFPSRPWSDYSCKNDEHKWVVVKFKKGLSEDERNKLGRDNPLKKTYRREDVFGNNVLPYCWDTFGAISFFGHECAAWCELPI